MIISQEKLQARNPVGAEGKAIGQKAKAIEMLRDELLESSPDSQQHSEKYLWTPQECPIAITEKAHERIVVLLVGYFSLGSAYCPFCGEQFLE